MKKLVIAAVLLGLAAALSAAEAVPQYVTLVIRDGRAQYTKTADSRMPMTIL